MGNNIGKMFTVTSFGESHGSCVGVIIDGCPAGLSLTVADVQKEVDKRKPGKGPASTPRAETDRVEIMSGVFHDFTTGAPIMMLIRNQDTDSSSYEKIKNLLRPGHADFTAYEKYGGFNDYRGGGRFSGRITAGYVMAGAVAQKVLSTLGIEIIANTVQIGDVKAAPQSIARMRQAATSQLRCADKAAEAKMLAVVEVARKNGDSLGGIIEGTALKVPVGLGEPVFDTLEGDLSKALFSIPAVKGVEFGEGFGVAAMTGSQNNDPFVVKNGKISTVTNHAGGILGGISNGMPLIVRVAVKPTPSISQPQQTVDISTMKNSQLEIKGRHDACIVPRAVPVVTAMMAIVLCDHAMRARLIPEVIK
ncbi:MAG TPA: chorismate synthase [Dehalococcoidales bacterium]|nr:chorismate synthase [Dehalococcoidales bacterium]